MTAGRVAITGGLGFIGAALGLRLAAAGVAVTAVDDRSGAYPPQVYDIRERALRAAGVQVITANVAAAGRDARERLRAADTVVHAAGAPSVSHGQLAPGRALAGNVGITAALLDTLAGVDAHLVHLSSSAVLGRTAGPATETPPQQCAPVSAYGESKRLAELVVHAWHAHTGAPVTVVRPFSIYGPDGRHDMLPMRLVDATRANAGVALRGWDDVARDWTFIADAVEVLRVLGGHPIDGLRTVNLGRGMPVSIAALVETWEAITDRRLERRLEALPAYEAVSTCADTSALARLVPPPSTDVRDGLAALWRWAA